jgi:TolA-binding protein
VLPGDEARIEAMVRAVQQRRSRRSAPVQARRVWLALVAGILVGGTAIAVVTVSKSLLEPAPPPATGNGPAREARVQAGAPKAARHESADAIRQVPLHSPVAPPRPLHRGRAALGAPTIPRTVPESSTPSAPTSSPNIASPKPEPGAATAGELFKAANQARMQADSARAIALYQRLQAEFPNSAEALSARLSLGMLYLRSGQANTALEQFRAYRALSHGSTVGDALWGESQALRQLGQRTAERRALEELLERFPDSVYAAAAKKRLAEP